MGDIVKEARKNMQEWKASFGEDYGTQVVDELIDAVEALRAQLAERDRELEQARTLVLDLVVSQYRDGWEHGPSEEEVRSYACDSLFNWGMDPHNDREKNAPLLEKHRDVNLAMLRSNQELRESTERELVEVEKELAERDKRIEELERTCSDLRPEFFVEKYIHAYFRNPTTPSIARGVRGELTPIIREAMLTQAQSLRDQLDDVNVKLRQAREAISNILERAEKYHFDKKHGHHCIYRQDMQALSDMAKAALAQNRTEDTLALEAVDESTVFADETGGWHARVGDKVYGPYPTYDDAESAFFYHDSKPKAQNRTEGDSDET